ncbi:MAG: FGGY family carbohydrate kinase [Patescibacteria group bacterium]
MKNLKTTGPLVLVIDAGTTNVKVFLINGELDIAYRKTVALGKWFPKRGWVEQNPEEIFGSVERLLREAIAENKAFLERIVGLGITNQRETTVCWDRGTGRPIYPAIVWEDERTLRQCAALSRRISNRKIRMKTGLTLAPYFSASKISWIIQNVPRAKTLISANRLAFGTVDSWLTFRLTGGKNHLTDFTNASRTLLFNIRSLRWDRELLALFEIPPAVLPEARPSFSFFGRLDEDIFGLGIPIMALAGDQQASLYAAGARPGVTKITYGTGAFILQNVGARFFSDNHLFTTVAAGTKRVPLYALEGKVAGCGSLVAPILGRDREMKRAIAKIALKVNRLLRHFPKGYDKIIVDGGISQANFMISEQGRVSKTPIQRQRHFEGTALGVAKLIIENMRVKSGSARR